MKSNDLQSMLIYPARLSFKMEGKIQSFPDKKSLREYISTKPALQEMLKALLYKGEERERQRERNAGKEYGNE